MLEIDSKVKVHSTYYDATYNGVTQNVNGLEGVVTGIHEDYYSPLFEVELVVGSMGVERLAFYAHELEVIENEEESK